MIPDDISQTDSGDRCSRGITCNHLLQVGNTLGLETLELFIRFGLYVRDG